MTKWGEPESLISGLLSGNERKPGTPPKTIEARVWLVGTSSGA